jgi:hypothetical protein
VWTRTVNGRVLHFYLAGINNQNFLMRDEETGSWWQQVTGEAILGPLKGRRLTRVSQDEISFGSGSQKRPWKVSPKSRNTLRSTTATGNRKSPSFPW